MDTKEPGGTTPYEPEGRSHRGAGPRGDSEPGTKQVVELLASILTQVQGRVTLAPAPEAEYADLLFQSIQASLVTPSATRDVPVEFRWTLPELDTSAERDLPKITDGDGTGTGTGSR